MLDSKALVVDSSKANISGWVEAAKQILVAELKQQRTLHLPKKKKTLAGKMQKPYRQKHKGREQKECERDREEEQEDGGAISSLIASHGGWSFSLQQWR